MMNVEDIELIKPILSIGDMITLNKCDLDEVMEYLDISGICYKQVSDYSIIITEV